MGRTSYRRSIWSGRRARDGPFDFSSLFWVFFAIMVLQPLFMGRWYAMRRAQAIRALEKSHASRVITMILRQEKRSLFGFVAPVGGDPGYLVKTPMRRGAVGWFIACRCCGREFESRGLAFCESCMALPAEERRKPLHGRPCQVPGCMAKISPRRRSDARYCEHHSAGRNGAKVVFSGVKVGRQPAGEKYEATREIPEQNQGPILGPKIWPINVVGGHRRPDDLTLDSALVGAILQCEVAS